MKFIKPRRFTLLELIIAIGIFLVMLLLLMKFFSAASTVWVADTSQSRVNENARLLFKVIEQDLRQAVASDQAEKEIPFFVDNNADQMPTFVSAIGRPSIGKYDSELAEVSYRSIECEVDDSLGGKEKVNFLQRQVIFSHIAQAPNSDWNFSGVEAHKSSVTASPTARTRNLEKGFPKLTTEGEYSWHSSNWMSNASGNNQDGPNDFVDVAGGVEEIKFRYYVIRGIGNGQTRLIEITPASLSSNYDRIADQHFNILPDIVDVSFTLSDYKSGNHAKQATSFHFYRRFKLNK